MLLFVVLGRFVVFWFDVLGDGRVVLVVLEGAMAAAGSGRGRSSVRVECRVGGKGEGGGGSQVVNRAIARAGFIVGWRQTLGNGLNRCQFIAELIEDRNKNAAEAAR